ncbi:MAG: hypothetical protein QXS54_12330 [Candidatus Methanomethylicaceae archaeon]
MEIWHRITFGHRDNVDSIIESLNIKHERSPLPGGGYLIHIDITESDPQWPRILELVQEKNALDIYDTFFTEPEILSAEWVRLIPIFEQGYPQPEATWVTNPINYAGKCRQCGAGFRQVAPFRLAKEPRMGKHDFLCLYWTYTVFVTPRVVEALRAAHIQGFDVWEAVIGKRNPRPSQMVSQLIFPRLAGPGLLAEGELLQETCPECGTTKYGYHKRGYMRFRRSALPEGVDFVQTWEWFGAGGRSAHREILVSQRVARLIIEQGWRGVRLKPLQLVE